MTDGVARWSAELQEVTRRAEALRDGVRPAALARRPGADAWSAAECVTHLTRTTEAYLPLLDAALAAAPPPGAGVERAPVDLLGRVMAWMLEPPYRMRSRTTAAFEPGAPDAPETVFAAFLTSQEGLAERLRRAAGRDLAGVRVVSPFNARVRYTIGSAFAILLAHQRRHLWQAERAVRAAAAIVNGAPGRVT